MIYVCFVICNLYYVGQINDLGIRVGPIHPAGGSNYLSDHIYLLMILVQFYDHHHVL
jgi:hypothetical protein